jgi:hypothetical protein
MAALMLSRRTPSPFMRAVHIPRTTRIKNDYLATYQRILLQTLAFHRCASEAKLIISSKSKLTMNIDIILGTRIVKTVGSTHFGFFRSKVARNNILEN